MSELKIKLGRGKMFSYRICGYTFHSNVPIDELIPDDEEKPEFSFELCGDTRRHSKSYQWLNHWHTLDGSKWLSFAKIEAGYLLRFPAFVDFVLSSDARSINGYLRNNCPAETMRHLLLNQVIPIVLSRLGKLVLHASACATPQGVMAFMGMTGMGKSTLAASFGIRGFNVLTDDCLLVEEQGEEMMTVPSYPGLRLWPESVSALFEEEPVLQPLAHYTDKRRFIFDQDHLEASLPLKAIYVLARPENEQEASEITITPLLASEALLEIVRHTFQLDVTDHERLAKSFKQYEWLVKSVPFFGLTYPRDHELLPAINAAILNHFALARQRPQKPS